MTGAGKAMRSKEALPQHTMESAMTVSLAQLKQSGWFAFPLAKMLVALACAAGHDQLAASFVRSVAVQIVCFLSDQIRSVCKHLLAFDDFLTYSIIIIIC